MRLTMNLSPTQTITPQMIATMTTLQYSAQELCEYLQELSCENPMVELEEPEKETGDFAEKLRWLRDSDRQNRSYYAPEEEGGQDAAAPESDSLERALLEQLLPLPLTAAETRAAKTVIALLDEHGFFDGELSEAARLAGVSTEDAGKALAMIQSLDPAGVGCRDVRECLLTQLQRRDTKSPMAERLISEQYAHLADRSPAQLARRMGVTEEAVRQALREISELSPYPGDGFVPAEQTVYVQPDVFVFPSDDGMRIWENTETLPHISVNGTYLELLKSTEDTEVRRYLREKFSQAEQVIRDLQNRGSTVLRCAEILAARQEAYFRGGELQKLTLRDVAEEMGVHESTVSRTVHSKYIQCRRGLFPMSHFFSRSVGCNGFLSRESIQETLSQLLRSENPAHPMSDEALARQLSARHITVSRRTVAKYRLELGIPSAFARKSAP